MIGATGVALGAAALLEPELAASLRCELQCVRVLARGVRGQSYLERVGRLGPCDFVC